MKNNDAMRGLLNQLLIDQPAAQVFFGGCSKEDKGKDKEKEKEKEESDKGKEKEQSDKGPDLTFQPTSQEQSGFSVGPEQRRFMVIMKDERSDLSAELLSDHLAHLQSLRARGRLVTCGAFIGGDGFKLIMASSKEEAERIAASDPIIFKGHYRSYEIRELQPRHLM